MRKFLLTGALCAITLGVSSLASAQDAPPATAQTADKTGADLLRAAHAALVTPYSYDAFAKELLPAEKLARQRKLVAANAPALALARRALRAGIATTLPKTPDAAHAHLELLSPSREIARQLGVEADVRAADGDALGAAQSSLDALELGAQISRGPLRMDALSGVAIAAVARRSLETHSALLDATQSREVADKWQRIGAGSADYSEVLRAGAEEIAMFLRGSDHWQEFDDPALRLQGLFAMKRGLADGEVAPAEADEALEAWAYSLDDIETDLRATFAQARAHAAMPYFAHSRAEPVRGANPYGTFIVQGFEPVSTRFSIERNRVQNSLLVAALRLRAIKLESGAYPATFNAPVDPFSPTLAPLIYQRAGESYLLYSVGPDGVDENGAAIQRVQTGAKTVTARLSSDSTGDIIAPVL